MITISNATTDIPIFLSLFFINSLSGLRFDLKLSIYCAFASILILIGFTIFDIQSGNINNIDLIINCVPKGLFLGATGLVSGYTGKKAKDLIVQNYLVQKQKFAALDMNPLTKLPGNISIAQNIQRSIDQKLSMSVIYCDLDNFKAFNDRYGFSAGDEVLLFTADILKNSLMSICNEDGFLGHIGGDDFLIIVPSDQVEAIADEIKKHFDEGIVSFYNETDRKQGYIKTVNRRGQSFKCPFISVSMGGVDISQRSFKHFSEISSACTECKKLAKRSSKTTLFFDRRS